MTIDQLWALYRKFCETSGTTDASATAFLVWLAANPPK